MLKGCGALTSDGPTGIIPYVFIIYSRLILASSAPHVAHGKVGQRPVNQFGNPRLWQNRGFRPTSRDDRLRFVAKSVAPLGHHRSHY